MLKNVESFIDLERKDTYIYEHILCDDSTRY